MPRLAVQRNSLSARVPEPVGTKEGGARRRPVDHAGRKDVCGEREAARHFEQQELLLLRTGRLIRQYILSACRRPIAPPLRAYCPAGGDYDAHPTGDLRRHPVFMQHMAHVPQPACIALNDEMP